MPEQTDKRDEAVAYLQNFAATLETGNRRVLSTAVETDHEYAYGWDGAKKKELLSSEYTVRVQLGPIEEPTLKYDQGGYLPPVDKAKQHAQPQVNYMLVGENRWDELVARVEKLATSVRDLSRNQNSLADYTITQSVAQNRPWAAEVADEVEEIKRRVLDQ